MPGENDRLPWTTNDSLDRILKREEGNTRPILVLVVSERHKDDCCAANFERAVLRSARVVALAKQFDCFLFTNAGKTPLTKRFALNAKKPAMLILDAEGGLIHKQQKCINPLDYLKILKSGSGLNKKRLKLRDRYMAARSDIRSDIDAGDYGKALRNIDRMLGKREFLLGDVISALEADRDEVATIGQEMFDRAVALQKDAKLFDALDLLQEVANEFKRVEKLGQEAKRCAKDLKKTLRDAGLRR
ncbi:MAG: hypothetical protein AAF581_19770 [Planctomycetota bacterium]